MNATLDLDMLYDSDAYAVVRVQWPDAVPAPDARSDPAPARGGFEIVDKFARKEIFLEGALAESFKIGVERLVTEGEPSVEDLDDYIARFAELSSSHMVLH